MHTKPERFAEVALNAPLPGTFTWHVPPELLAMVRPGQLVQVRFRTALQPGLIVELKDSSEIAETLPLQSLFDPEPLLNAQQIALAQWISRRYRMPPGPCLWLFLPPGVGSRRGLRVSLREAAIADEQLPADAQAGQLLALLRRRGPLTNRQLSGALPGSNWRETVERLEAAGLLRSEPTLLPPPRPQLARTAALAISRPQIGHVARQLGRKSRRAALLQEVAAAGPQGLTVNEALARAETTRSTLRRAEQEGLLRRTPHEDGERVVSAVAAAALEDRLIALRQAERPLRALRLLARADAPVALTELRKETGVTRDQLERLEELGLIHLGESETWHNARVARDFVPDSAPPLTPGQHAVWQEIEAELRRWPQVSEGARRRFLLHGVTGSGKTEIYLRAIELTLEQGRQALFLVPEIALTAQTLRRVAARFPGQVAVSHSGLGDGERHHLWRRAREGEIKVVVGTRSALYTPLPEVGLVVLDEEHDASYRQGTDAAIPYYHARSVAGEMMRANKGILLLGSATPDVETYYHAQRGDLRLLQLPQRIMGHRRRIRQLADERGLEARYVPAPAGLALMIELASVQLVDMRSELRTGNTGIFSRKLLAALREVLASRQQALFFLNRRGANTWVFCRDCGHVERCPHCDSALTWHRHDGRLRCHLCNHERAAPRNCPECRSRRIRYFGAGTQQVEQELQRHFPRARVLRWDADSARKASAHDHLLQRFADHEADVLVGTQMIAKGLDLPLVTLAGVVSADHGLNLPDFRAGERSFQLLTQVAGRAGRGLAGGRAILQTYQPEHYAIQTAAAQDYKAFYEQEIAWRRELGHPPLRRLARILIQHENDARAQQEAGNAAQQLRRIIHEHDLRATELIGPAPCFFTRIRKQYRWHLLLRSPDPALALDGLSPGRDWLIDLDPVDLL